MFSHKKNDTETESTLINSETVFTGNIKCRKPLTIKGQFHGKITCESKVELSSNSMVKGNIEAESLIINGQIIGDISTKKEVIILFEGEVIGDIQADQLEVASGAIFNGQCKVGNCSNATKDSIEEVQIVSLNQKSA